MLVTLVILLTLATQEVLLEISQTKEERVAVKNEKRNKSSERGKLNSRK